MSEITNHSAIQLTKAQNIQDVEVALQQIAETANESLAAALNAQIQVLRYVQSPKLYDSSFDLLFANVRKAIKMTDSSKEREMIREKSVVMINNYIFFMQAKNRLRYSCATFRIRKFNGRCRFDLGRECCGCCDSSGFSR